jgi:hypothetical protein
MYAVVPGTAGSLLLTVAPAIRPGTVSLPKGIWRQHTNNLTGTALVPDR